MIKGVALLPVGCTWLACSVHPGLANAPALGGAPADSRVHDVVANGRDSCERRAVGGTPLRGRWPPCPTAGDPSSVAGQPLVFETRHARYWVDPSLARWPYCLTVDEYARTPVALVPSLAVNPPNPAFVCFDHSRGELDGWVHTQPLW